MVDMSSSNDLLSKEQEGGSRQTYTHATISTHYFASSFPLVVVYGWNDSRRKGLLLHYVSRPRVVTCGRASRFSRQNATRGPFRLYAKEQELNLSR